MKFYSKHANFRMLFTAKGKMIEFSPVGPIGIYDTDDKREIKMLKEHPEFGSTFWEEPTTAAVKGAKEAPVDEFENDTEPDEAFEGEE
jgi:hypothetical protein